jgi:hypothetical protein
MFCEYSETALKNIIWQHQGHQTKQHKGLPTFLLIRHRDNILADAESVLLPMGNTMTLFVKSTHRDQLQWVDNLCCNLDTEWRRAVGLHEGQQVR